MKKIDGIDLAEEVAEAKEQVLKERRLAVQKQIRGILTDIIKWDAQKRGAQNLIAKCDIRIMKASEKLEQIRGGDWSVLSDDESSENL